MRQHLRLKWVLLEAADRPTRERPEYLQRTCADDPELVSEARRLLDDTELGTPRRESFLTTTHVSVFFDGVHWDPRFSAIVRRMGL